MFIKYPYFSLSTFKCNQLLQISTNKIISSKGTAFVQTYHCTYPTFKFKEMTSIVNEILVEKLKCLSSSNKDEVRLDRTHSPRDKLNMPREKVT